MFAEHRKNAQLYNGDHYGNKTDHFDRNVKQFAKSDTQAIRITENHINKIISMRASALKNLAPDVTVRPKNFDEFGDQKRAEIHKSILEDWKKQSCFKEEEIRLIKEWFIYGEIGVKIYWDDAAGRRLPDMFVSEIEAEFDKVDKDSVEATEIVIDVEDIKHKKITRFEGRVQVEMLYPFDIIRDPCAETYKEAEWVCVKKLVNPDVLKKHFSKNDDKYKAVAASKGEKFETFRVNGQYSKTDNKVLVKEYYFRKSYRYPNGYFYIVSGSEKPMILWEGELPGGVFPVEILGYDEITTSPRYSSLIRHLRPNQLQVNLFKSKALEAALKTGNDRVYVQKGTKLSKPMRDSSGILIREYTGQKPITEQGRVGEQFLGPIDSNIAQMYDKASVQSAFDQKSAQVDAHTALYQSARQKAVYNDYVCKYQNFLANMYEKVMKLTKLYLKEESIIFIAGKDEQINIPEYKTSDDLGYEICFEAQSEDAESKLGRSLDLQKILQYGANFDGAQLAALIKNMPYLNNEAILETFPQYQNYRNALNDVCRLDRGDQSVLNVRQYEDHDFMIQFLIARTKKPDFDFLPDLVKQLYLAKIQIHEQTKVQQIQQARALEADNIPSSGALLRIEGLVENTGTRTRDGTPKTRPVRLPQDAINWLRDRLKQQGVQLAVLENQQEQVRAEIAGQVVQAEQAQIAQAQQEQAILAQLQNSQQGNQTLEEILL